MNNEKDPDGLNQHAPGAKLDNGKLRVHLVLGAFAHALSAVSEVGTFGANKYSDNGWLQVENGVDRYSDAMLRHYLKECSGEMNDPDSGIHHAAHLAWNALARLELMCRESEMDIQEPSMEQSCILSEHEMRMYDLGAGSLAQQNLYP